MPAAVPGANAMPFDAVRSGTSLDTNQQHEAIYAVAAGTSAASPQAFPPDVISNVSNISPSESGYDSADFAPLASDCVNKSAAVGSKGAAVPTDEHNGSSKTERDTIYPAASNRPAELHGSKQPLLLQQHGEFFC